MKSVVSDGLPASESKAVAVC